MDYSNEIRREVFNLSTNPLNLICISCCRRQLSTCRKKQLKFQMNFAGLNRESDMGTGWEMVIWRWRTMRPFLHPYLPGRSWCLWATCRKHTCVTGHTWTSVGYADTCSYITGIQGFDPFEDCVSNHFPFLDKLRLILSRLIWI